MIVDDIRHGNSEPYGVEPLRELLKLLPETEEVTNSSTHQHTFNKQVNQIELEQKPLEHYLS